MKASDFTRNACKLGGKRITYARLLRDYRCQECGGRLVEKPPNNQISEWHVECGRCGEVDFIHECELRRRRYEAVEVLDGLPPEVAAQLA